MTIRAADEAFLVAFGYMRMRSAIMRICLPSPSGGSRSGIPGDRRRPAVSERAPEKRMRMDCGFRGSARTSGRPGRTARTLQRQGLAVAAQQLRDRDVGGQRLSNGIENARPVRIMPPGHGLAQRIQTEPEARDFLLQEFLFGNQRRRGVELLREPGLLDPSVHRAGRSRQKLRGGEDAEKHNDADQSPLPPDAWKATSPPSRSSAAD